MLEVEFWQARHRNLQGIVRQMAAPGVRNCVTILAKAESTYVKGFDDLMNDLDDALAEARDVSMHYGALRAAAERLEMAGLSDLVSAYAPVLHLLSLAWFTSKRLTTASLITFLREVANVAVAAARGQLMGTDLFGEQPSAAVTRLEQAREVLAKLKEMFFAYRAQVNSQHRARPWRVEDSVIFHRVDKLLQRVDDLLDVFRARVEFSAASGYELGGPRGHALGQALRQISGEFNEAFHKLREAFPPPKSEHHNFALLDVSPGSTFESHLMVFTEVLRDLDRRLAHAVSKRFEDACTVQQGCLLVEGVQGQLVRGAVVSDTSDRLGELLALLSHDIDDVHLCFEVEQTSWQVVPPGAHAGVGAGTVALADRKGPQQAAVPQQPAPDHVPAIAGLLHWANGLLDRVQMPMEKLTELNSAMLLSPEGKQVHMRYQLLRDNILRWKEDRLQEWKSYATSLCLERLDNTLLRRLGSTGRLVVNFCRDLAQVLDGVRALQGFGVDLGHNVMSVYMQRDDFRIANAKLSVVATQYNHIIETIIEVERPLVKRSLDHIHLVLQEGLEDLTWRSPRVSDFIARVSRSVSGLHGSIIYLKGNISCIVKILRHWKCMWKVIHFNEAESMEHRRKSILHELTAMWQGETGSGLSDSEKIAKKWLKRWRDRVSTKIRSVDDVVRQNRRIHRLVEHSRELLRVDAGSPAWCSYVDYINDIFKQGFLLAVKKSLEHLIHFLEMARDRDVYGHAPEGGAGALVRKGAGGMSAVRAGGAADSSPLLEVEFCLATTADGKREASFNPSISRDVFGSVQYRVYEWCHTIFEVGRQLQRLDDPESHYYALLFDDHELNSLKDRIMRLMHETIEKLQDVRMDFQKYSYLWMDDVDAIVERFVAGRMVLPGQEDVPKTYDVFEESDDENTLAVAVADPEPEAAAAGEEEEDGQAEQMAFAKPTLRNFETQIKKYEDLQREISALPGAISYGWLRLDTSPLKTELCDIAGTWRSRFLQHLRNRVVRKLDRFKRFVSRTEAGIHCESAVLKYDELVKIMCHLVVFNRRCEAIDHMFEPLKETVVLLRKHEVMLPQAVLQDIEDAPVLWRDLKRHCFQVNEMLQPRQLEETGKIREYERVFDARIAEFHQARFTGGPECKRRRALAPTTYDLTPRQAYKAIAELHLLVTEKENKLRELREKQKLFQLVPFPGRLISECRVSLTFLKKLWDAIAVSTYQMDAWNHMQLARVDVDAIELRVRRLVVLLRGLDKRVRKWDAYCGIENRVKVLLATLPLVTSLRHPAIRASHWEELMSKTGVRFSFSDQFTLANLLSLKLHEFPDEVNSMVGKAVKQRQIEEQIQTVERVWKEKALDFRTPEGLDHPIFSVSEEVQQTIEEHQVTLQNLALNRYVDSYITEVQRWQRTLGTVESVLTLFVEVQQTWRHLQSIFVCSDDIRTQLPGETQLFLELDSQVKYLLREAARVPAIVPLCLSEGKEETLSSIRQKLHRCERALEDYLLQKRAAFPRFYFVSVPHLLEILSLSGRNPRTIMQHIPRIVNDMRTLVFDDEEATEAVGAAGIGGETFSFDKPVVCAGRVEAWLQRVLDTTASSVRGFIEQAVHSYTEKPRGVWLDEHLAQVVLVASQIHWNADVAGCFHAIGEGNERALHEQRRRADEQLTFLIQLVGTDLDAPKRRKVTNLATNDVHARDAISELIERKVDLESAFAWTRQLRHRWDDKLRCVRTDICDGQFEYGYEFLGNELRLVVTPLTERIYITLTQSLHLRMGGAPSGPAGTGKTETVKDLARRMGKPCYVFNCSEQMNSVTLANIFKGLSSAGAWGCFDEFNRIRLAVLSVVAAQYRCILDALREGRRTFRLGDKHDVTLDPTTGVFITMNPSYLGRTEIPDNLKALFRPVTVAAPDNAMICENLLLAEGFSTSRVLARKFIALFKLCNNLLSKQQHYDWGLRAIKSLLVLAGSLKRAQPQLDEDALLMRALRDFNLPKIVEDDVDVFHGLIQDLFPGVRIGRREDLEFEGAVRRECAATGLQPEDGLVLKCAQLDELMTVRHSIFVIGPPAAGKTTCIKTLSGTYRALGHRTTDHVINPKAVTSHELFGWIDVKTKEWHDGLLSGIMRTLAEMPPSEDSVAHRWIIFDGDIDTEWIESMNSAMDDNKVLTLANNDRITLTPSMRLIFEIHRLIWATPATVSRAGTLYLSTHDIGWLPFVQSWFDRKSMSSMVTPMVDKYVMRCLEWVELEGKTALPMSDFAFVQQLCAIAENVLAREVRDEETHNDRDAEHWFVLACIWAFGGMLITHEGVDYRQRFDKWWRHEWRTLKFPEAGTVFDYCLSAESRKLERWSERLKHVALPDMMEVPLKSLLIPTTTTLSIDFILDLILPRGHPIMLVGDSGVGKTLMLRERVRHLPEQYGFQEINFNYFTDAATLQRTLERKLERKMGRRYGPVGKQAFVWLIDDLNMPLVDKYGTQSPIALLRQHLDSGMWYDRTQWRPTYVDGVQYVTALNPTAGSFTLNERFMRHFVSLHMPPPSREAMTTIYGQVLAQHLQRFGKELGRTAERVVAASLDVFEHVAREIPKTPVRFHYEVSLRQLAQIVEGLSLFSVFAVDAQVQPQSLPGHLIRLWAHEVHRTFGDRLSTEQDQATFRQILTKVTSSCFMQQYEVDSLLAEPLIFSSFCEGAAQCELGVYGEIESVEALRDVLEQRLRLYNERHPVMDLVLHTSAIEHCARISRVLERPHGHMLLIGVGGNGRQSLSRLAAWVCGYLICSPRASISADLQVWREELRSLYVRSGVKGDPVVLLLSDAQIFDERLLVDVNDILSTGEVPDLFLGEERDEVIRRVRPEVRQAMIVDTADNCWSFLLDKVQRNMHVVLCFGPGQELRVRSRRFPALVSCTVQDWFYPWSVEALESVATRVIEPLELGVEGTQDAERTRRAVVEFIASVHNDASQAAPEFNREFGQQIFVAPKSYLEMLQTFSGLLSDKLSGLDVRRGRLETGLAQLTKARADSVSLQEVLSKKQVTVSQKKAAVDDFLVRLASEKRVVESESNKCERQEMEAQQMQQLVKQQARECEEDLAKAEPLLDNAQRALDTLNKSNLTELKSFKSPPVDVQNVMACVVILLSPANAPARDKSWAAAQKFMQRIDIFLQTLKTYNKEHIPATHIAQLRPYLENPEFTGDAISQKSAAAAGLCEWVRNVVKYFEVHCYVQPKRENVAESKLRLEEMNQKLSRIKGQLAKVRQRYTELEAEVAKAQDDRDAVVHQAEECAERLELSQRLVNSLGSEQGRWESSVVELAQQRQVMVGDVLLAAALVVYAGPFNHKYRKRLLDELWVPRLQASGIPHTQAGLDPVNTLTTAAQIAAWSNQDLPRDHVSVQNACIVTHSRRPVLLIDPQLQGLCWLCSKDSVDETEHARRAGATGLVHPAAARRASQVGEAQTESPEDEQPADAGPQPNPEVGRRLVIARQGKGMLDSIEPAMAGGQTALVEHIGEEVDPMLTPILERQTVHIGAREVLHVGDREIEWDPKFNLVLHTKLRNPRYPPEMHARVTMVNFSVTPEGLEEQLLVLVVNKDLPDLEKQLQANIFQANEFRIRITALEEGVIQQFAGFSRTGRTLVDRSLVESLEDMTQTARSLAEKAEESRQVELQIKVVRNDYRDVARRGALLYFILIELELMEWLYQSSLQAFAMLFYRTVDSVPRPETPENLGGGYGRSEADERHQTERRVRTLVDSITLATYHFVRRGIFERHKLAFALLLCFAILEAAGKLDKIQLEFFVGQRQAGVRQQRSPAPWMTEHQWKQLRQLSTLEVFSNLSADVAASLKRWQEWCDAEHPEEERLPGDWRSLGDFHRLLIIKALRPDRLCAAASNFIAGRMGEEYVRQPPVLLQDVFKETSPSTPVLFILFPGADPLREVEALGRKLGVSQAKGTLSAVAMGEGQGDAAREALRHSAENGGWVVLQNIHLMGRWLNSLEQELEDLCKEPHREFRVWITAEPSDDPEKRIPPGIIQSSIKLLSNEPPQRVQPNVLRAWSCFTPEMLEASSKTNEFKSLLFALAFFHGVVIGRKRFGTQGWSQCYSFTNEDLIISAQVVHNYLEQSTHTIPWDDMRYLIGEIMYGGHITDPWDRRCCMAYLESLLREELFVTGELAPEFNCPQPGSFQHYVGFIEGSFPPETPQLLSMHFNAEIKFLTTQASLITDTLRTLRTSTVAHVQSADLGSGATPSADPLLAGMEGEQDQGSATTSESRLRDVVDELSARLPERMQNEFAPTKGSDPGPVAVFVMQECERMGVLLATINQSLADCIGGLRGRLTISEQVEDVLQALDRDRVPAAWRAVAYPSLKPLRSWFEDLLRRYAHLESWAADMAMPAAVWLGGLFSPMSFLTVVLQVSARRGAMALDRLALTTDVTKKAPEDATAPPREGAFIWGLYLDGAKWDPIAGQLAVPELKQLHPPLPMLQVRAVPDGQIPDRPVYQCPVYSTTRRGEHYVFTAQLRIADPNQTEWILRGCCAVLSLDE
eukprot:TRINITY_DN1939_c0_g6_i1.p1 TRINITY_DN1939_c0_g6~~TRINITY_DN1939_c0_g6_i1.p1  ORF type:complete len:4792 (+),score=1866.14 TRINITY_DN1939_c0_g6_i1:876-14378(+)